MKAAPFDYVRAESVEHALSLLARHGGEAKLIAGGQSLVPMMAMRLTRPSIVIDIHRLAELAFVDRAAASVRMGACTRQRTIEDAGELDGSLPLMRRALAWVGHGQTRNRGTVGGSLAHADPSAELPLAALMLDATLSLRSEAAGDRRVAAGDFFLGPMATAIGESECLIGIEWPVWQGSGVGAAFEEIAIRHGDFAMASAACQLQLDAAGVCRRSVIGAGGVGGTPLVFPQAAGELTGRRINRALAQHVAHAAALQCDPGNDIHASAAYRRHLAAVLIERTILEAAANGVRH